MHDHVKGRHGWTEGCGERVGQSRALAPALPAGASRPATDLLRAPTWTLKIFRLDSEHFSESIPAPGLSRAPCPCPRPHSKSPRLRMPPEFPPVENHRNGHRWTCRVDPNRPHVQIKFLAAVEKLPIGQLFHSYKKIIPDLRWPDLDSTGPLMTIAMRLDVRKYRRRPRRADLCARDKGNYTAA